MDFIEVNENIDYENIGYVNEDGTFEKSDNNELFGVNNFVVNNPPQNLVDN